ncbi:hypothetical protein A6R68_03200, partial [Neotoma lepida]
QLTVLSSTVDWRSDIYAGRDVQRRPKDEEPHLLLSNVDQTRTYTLVHWLIQCTIGLSPSHLQLYELTLLKFYEAFEEAPGLGALRRSCAESEHTQDFRPLLKMGGVCSRLLRGLSPGAVSRPQTKEEKGLSLFRPRDLMWKRRRMKTIFSLQTINTTENVHSKVMRRAPGTLWRDFSHINVELSLLAKTKKRPQVDKRWPLEAVLPKSGTL